MTDAGFLLLQRLYAAPWSFLFVLASSALAFGAEAHNHPAQDAAIHEQFYSTWMRPDRPDSSCCNLQDCYPTTFKQEGGRWYALRREDRQWVHVPDAKIEHLRNDGSEPRQSPDHRSHVCMTPPYPDGTSTVYCGVIAEGT